MGYSGPGYGILSLAVSEKYIWCLDYKGGLFCSALPGAGLRWQKFEDAVQQVAVSPSGSPRGPSAGTGCAFGVVISPERCCDPSWWAERLRHAQTAAC